MDRAELDDDREGALWSQSGRDERGWVPYAPGQDPRPGRPAPPDLPRPPATGEPNPAGDRPIVVSLDARMLGDLGNARVDARLIRAMLLRDGRVAAWLRERGIDEEDVEAAFPGTGWE